MIAVIVTKVNTIKSGRGGGLIINHLHKNVGGFFMSQPGSCQVFNFYRENKGKWR